MKLIQILLIFYYMLPIGNTQEPKRTRKQKLKKKPQYIYIYNPWKAGAATHLKHKRCHYSITTHVDF
jgi:hypothetical protein